MAKIFLAMVVNIFSIVVNIFNMAKIFSA